MRRNRDYVSSRQTIKHVDAVLKLFSALTRDHRFEEAQNDFREGETVTMQSVLDKVEARGLAKGRAEGEAKGRAEGLRQAARAMLERGMDLETISDLTGLSEDELLSMKK